jgi:N-acetylglucosaminyldiphosphoundecaprenol N-acetyl-beta-D-mannosaminyltransferase
VSETEVRIFDVPLTPVLPAQLIVYIDQAIQDRRSTLICNANIHCLNLAYELPWLRQFLQGVDLTFIDGMGIVLGSYLLGIPISPMTRMTPPDWIDLLADLCEVREYALFFLGAQPGVAHRAAQRLQEQHPKLQIAGTHHGYFNKQRNSDENQSVLRTINRAKPNLLLVGFGMPLQERWLMENWQDLEVNVSLPVGALFDYLSGEERRGPGWMTDHGLEWLARVIIEPRRLWRRYLIGNPLFMYRLLKQRLGLGSHASSDQWPGSAPT